MKIIKGNKQLDLSKDDFTLLTKNYEKRVVDLGTGDGRFVYKNAESNPQNIYIGVDTNGKILSEYSKKALKKKVDNILFVIGSLEVIPEDLKGIADVLYVNLPWGSLLQAIVKPTSGSITLLKSLINKGGILEIIFGYDPSLEPGETKRLDLNQISKEYIVESVIPVFEQGGFSLHSLNLFTSDDLKTIESTWGKKIASRNKRPFYKLSFSL